MREELEDIQRRVTVSTDAELMRRRDELQREQRKLARDVATGAHPGDGFAELELVFIRAELDTRFDRMVEERLR